MFTKENPTLRELSVAVSVGLLMILAMLGAIQCLS